MHNEKRNKINKKTAPKPNAVFTVSEKTLLLDFLLLNIKGKSRNNIKTLLAKKAILVEGIARTKFDYPLKAGQTVTVQWLVPEYQPKHKSLDIIYEDKDLIVINKPAGLLSVATEKVKDNTAYHLITDYVKEKNPDFRIWVVHRLDRDTSGVMVVAKNEEMKLALQDNWNELVSYRGYRAVVERKLECKKDRIRSWLIETKTHLMFSSTTPGDGQEAITNYEVLSENNEFSLLDIWLETGRKNQIRVHMKDIGHPIIGDKTYGAHADPLKRLGLHAHKLEVKNPKTGKIMTFEAPSPSRFATLTR